MSAPRRRRWLRPALIGVAVVAVAVAATFANVALLGAVGEDRIGRLRPVDPSLTSVRAPSAPTVGEPGITLVTPSTIGDGDDGSSGHGRGRGRPDDD